MGRPTGLIYSNSRRVELIDPNTMNAVDYFINAASFCKNFGITKNKASQYLTQKSHRIRMNGMICRYKGDTYWESLKRKARKVEVLDADTLELKMTFDSTVDFCKQFNVPKTCVYSYVRKLNRSKFRSTMLIQYEGDNYWEMKKKEEEGKDKKQDNSLSKAKEAHRQEVKRLKEHIVRLNQFLAVKDMEIQKLKQYAESITETGDKDTDNDDLNTDHVKTTVCKHCMVPESVIDSSSRKDTSIWPRHLYSWMVYKRVVPNGNSMTAIGTMTGGRTHASVLNSIKKVNNRIETDRDFRDSVLSILSVYGLSCRLEKKGVELCRI
jgi:hypothetical protein